MSEASTTTTANAGDRIGQDSTSPASGVRITMDGQPLDVAPGTTLYEAARQAGIDIPVLCHSPKLEPVGVCRMCVVEVEGSRVLQAACVRQAEDGMVVHTNGDKVTRSRAMLTELLMADYPKSVVSGQWSAASERQKPPATGHRPPATAFKPDLLLELAAEQGVETPRFPARQSLASFDNGRDLSSPVIAVDHNACILCDRCIRACDDVQCNDVIGRAGKGYTARISFDNDLPMGQSSCVSCGECMAACPTGALTDKPLTLPLLADADHKQVDSLCPYCGVGCSITYTVDTKANTIVQVSRPRQPGEPRASVRQGPLRLRLRTPRRAPAGAADSQAGVLPEAPRTARRAAPGVPRSDLGRGPRPGGAAFHGPSAKRTAARRWPASAPPSARRGQLPVPEAYPRRLRHQQRRSLHAVVPRLLGGRPARPDRRRLGVEPVFRRPGHRRHLHHRLQHHAQPPGGGDVHQAGRQRRRHAARCRPAATRDRRPRRPLRALQPRH